jgi:tetratricopeptide (TPR) repeat protein
VLLHAGGILVFAGCNGSHAPVEKSEAGELAATMATAEHEAMRSVLAQIAERGQDESPFVGDRHARELRSLLAVPGYAEGLGKDAQWRFYLDLGIAELRLGKEEKAIEQLKVALDLAPSTSRAEFATKTSHYQLGVAWLRFGETQNCCQRNNADSCIVPIKGDGIHVKEQGSRNAIEHLSRVLDFPANPEDEEERLEVDESARWLINIAYMTLGEYPQKVPEKYRVAKKVFEPEEDFPVFRNIMPELGLQTFNLCGGVVMDDFDNDLDLDIITCSWDLKGQTRVFRNDGSDEFTDVTKASGLEGFYGGLNLNQADYDNDGDLDVFIMRGAWLKANGLHPNSLLRNDGELRFTDVTISSGVGALNLPTKTSGWADYDNDGDLDLYVGNETSEKVHAPCQLFRNEGNGTFVDVASQAGVADERFSMGAVWGDYNGDRYPDLFLSLVGDNKLYRNNKDGTFTDVATELGITEPPSSFAAWFWDFDNDGHLDIYVGCNSGPVGVIDTNMRFYTMKLWRNRGDGSFVDVAAEKNLLDPAEPMGSNFGDLDNDGFLDFYLATGNTSFAELRPNIMYHNQGGQRFANVTMSGGFGHLQKGHGVSFGDFDNDGDQDVYVQLGGAYPADKNADALFENPGTPFHSVMLKLEGRQSNRCAIGAKIRLHITEHGVSRMICKDVTSGSSFGANPLRQSIGTGSASVIDKLEIYWPTTDTTQEFLNLDSDSLYHIVEGEKQLERIKVTPFPRSTTKQMAMP